MEEKQNGYCILNPIIAKALLTKGNQIINIKPNKTDRKRTVFVFLQTEKFNRDLKEIIDEREKRKA